MFLENLVFVAASDLVEKISPGDRTPDVRTVLEVIQRDICTSLLLFAGSGETADHIFQVAGNLSSANLTASVMVFDIVTQLTSTFDVNLSWKATAKAEFVHTKETFQDPELGIKITAQSRGRLAEAVATGMVVGDGQNFTPQASDTATIQKQNDGVLTIQKTR
jgi:hypothetical protein